jgi:putative ABC transport system permease protein
LGLVTSTLTSLVFVPQFSRLAIQNLTEADIIISFHPGIYIGAALFALVTAIIGALSPSKKAATISAIEAVRFTEYGYKREEIRSAPFNPVRIAWRNVFRVNRRAVWVFVSLFIGMTLFLVVTVITGGLRNAAATGATTGIGGMDRFGGSDIMLTNWSWEQQVFTPEIMEKINALPGLTDIKITYMEWVDVFVYTNRGERSNIGMGQINALNESAAARFNTEVCEPFDVAAFMRGEFVVVRDIGNPAFIDAEYANFQLRGSDELLSFKIGGIEPAHIMEGWGMNSMPKISMSDNLLHGFVSEPVISRVELFIESDSDKQRQALDMVIEWTGDIENIQRLSEIEIWEDAENGTVLFAFLGNSISFIFCFIGILNFINIISTSILSRRHELALFESIGQSKRQTIKMLMFEGMIYAVISLILTCIFGGLLSYWLFSLAFAAAFAAGIDASVIFGFPYPFAAMVTVIFVICLSVPRIVYRSVSKSAIVDRLREIE